MGKSDNYDQEALGFNPINGHPPKNYSKGAGLPWNFSQSTPIPWKDKSHFLKDRQTDRHTHRDRHTTLYHYTWEWKNVPAYFLPSYSLCSFTRSTRSLTSFARINLMQGLNFDSFLTTPKFWLFFAECPFYDLHFYDVLFYHCPFLRLSEFLTSFL